MQQGNGWETGQRARIAIGMVVGSLLFSGCGSSGSTGTTPGTQGRARWQSRGIDSYAYTLQVSAFTTQEYNQPVRVTVRNGVTESVRYVDPSIGDDPGAGDPFFDDFETIDKLFEKIEDAQQQNADELRAQYDAVYGFPKDVFVDIREQMADEEYGFKVTDFAEL
jgi:hypothetical protein